MTTDGNEEVRTNHADNRCFVYQKRIAVSTKVIAYSAAAIMQLRPCVRRL